VQTGKGDGSMKSLKAMFVGMLAITVISGCTARSLSVLQADFNATVKAKQNCKSEDENVARDPSCMVDPKTIFADIAVQAKKSLNDYNGGQSVKIALHRLHAYALWQSGASEKVVVSAAQNGLKECRGDNFTKAPRDCALLATVGIFKVIQEAAARVTPRKNEIMKADANEKEILCSEHVAGWRKEASNYWSNAYVPLVKKIKEIAEKEGVPKSVLTYLEDQRKAARKPIIDLKTIGNNCVPDWADRNLIAKCPCDPGRRNEHPEACYQVYGQGNLKFSFYHEILCIKEALRK
jgi:hypothetical protein